MLAVTGVVAGSLSHLPTLTAQLLEFNVQY